ncbi:MAG: Asp-tRNA(Asn)/Glu-tRNA(Gln) amidotransferase subunit GatB [Candidatus Pacearchaeota archaeon]
MNKTKIGLEIHGYLVTNEKLFCSCKSEHGAKFSKPNTNICPTCTGQPGAKPMLPNARALNKTIDAALILGCKINENLVWKRKHYSWPDLPKGYQNTISGAHSDPVGIKGKFAGIGITEVHLEEDPAAWNPKTGEIDYNRSGSPLIEIVTEPEFKNPEEVIGWLKQLILTLSYIKAVDKKLGLKADVNISTGGERIEIKNVNSLRNIKTALEYEIARQKKERPKEKETRMFDESKGITKKMRAKEAAQDYRFISEPDLPKMNITSNRIKKAKDSLPETPQKKLERLIKKYKIPENSAKILIRNIDVAELFEETIEKSNPRLAIRWITEELLSVLNYNKKELSEVEIKPEHFIELLKLIEEKKITEHKAREILRSWTEKSSSPKEVVSRHKIISEKEVKKISREVIKENPMPVQDYKEGKEQALNFLMGQVMRKSDKRAGPQEVKEVLRKILKGKLG